MLFLFTTSCEQDDGLEILQTEATQSPFKLKTVKLDDIPIIKDYLNSKTNNIFYKESTDKDGAIFDTENIMEVMDTLNYANYSFRFVYPDTPVGTFYNLVAGKTPEGETKEPFVLKYVCDENQLQEYLNNNKNFSYFKGSIALHKYTDFFTNGYFYKGDVNCPENVDQYGDPIPCYDYNVNGSSSGGGDSNENGDSVGGGGTTPGTGGGITIVWSDIPDDDTTDGGTKTLNLKSPRYFSKKDDTTSDCSDCPTSVDGGVGVNSPDKIDIDPISFANYECQEKIVTSIYKNKSQLSNFITSAFGGTQNDVNLIYKLGAPKDPDTNLPVDGLMDPDYNSLNKTLDATITLNTEMATQATDLYIATITIHENLHAVLAYAILINNLTTSPNPDLYELSITYARWMKATGKTTDDEHAFMATMVDKIAESLKVYGQNKGYNLLDTYYNDLSWSGGIGVNNDTFLGLSFSKRMAIRNALDNERNPEDDGSNPSGNKCN